MAKEFIPIPDDDNVDVPDWDVALESLMREQFFHTRSLRLAEIEKLAQEYSIRFDDLIVTAFELVIQGKWKYLDENGKEQPVDRTAVNRLYVNGRIHRDDVAHYTGSWIPDMPG